MLTQGKSFDMLHCFVTRPTLLSKQPDYKEDWGAMRERCHRGNKLQNRGALNKKMYRAEKIPHQLPKSDLTRSSTYSSHSYYKRHVSKIQMQLKVQRVHVGVFVGRKWQRIFVYMYNFSTFFWCGVKYIYFIPFMLLKYQKFEFWSSSTRGFNYFNIIILFYLPFWLYAYRLLYKSMSIH